MINIKSEIPNDFVSSVLHKNPTNRSISNSKVKLQQDSMLSKTKQNSKPTKPRMKREKLFTTPEKLSDFLNQDSNKLIHLDPIPIFNDKSQIKPWLQKIFFPQGIDLVIERSDQSKVIFKCRTVTRPSSNENENDNELEQKLIITTKNCPFRIRASFSLKLQKWNVVIINNTHSHQCIFNPDSDEYKKFKTHLVNENDTETIKEFEELEYKTRFKLPILPKVISCDCGLTNEVNWFNVVIPQPKISGTKKICKKTSTSINSTVNSTSAQTNDLSKLLELDNSNINIVNPKIVTPPENITNLDEIDFTGMFATKKEKKKVASFTNLSNSNLHFNNHIDDNNLPVSIDNFDLNKIITTESNYNLIADPLNFNPINDSFADIDFNNILNDESTNKVDLFIKYATSTTSTTINTLVEPTDWTYLDHLNNDFSNILDDKSFDTAYLNQDNEMFSEPNIKDENETTPTSLYFDPLL